MKFPTLHVKAEWDPEAEVWVATSEDVPGLVAEAQDFESLREKVEVLIPELLEANGRLPQDDGEEIPYEVESHREGTIAIPAH